MSFGMRAGARDTGGGTSIADYYGIVTECSDDHVMVDVVGNFKQPQTFTPRRCGDWVRQGDAVHPKALTHLHTIDREEYDRYTT